MTGPVVLPNLCQFSSDKTLTFSRLVTDAQSRVQTLKERALTCAAPTVLNSSTKSHVVTLRAVAMARIYPKSTILKIL